jgi:hypothetical protein
MRDVVASIEGEFRRYKALGEGAIAQLRDGELCAEGGPAANSVAVVVWHVGGNLASRFTDFLTIDGEKPWRDRDEEFASRTVTREALVAKWESGWSVLLASLAPLTDADLARMVTIRSQPLTVVQALHRSLSHTSYHVGQIVHIAKLYRGDDWKSLSIPRGKSAEYNRAPTSETGHAAADELAKRTRG